MICCENVIKYCGRNTFFFNSSPDCNHYFFFLPFSAMALPLFFFFTPYFDNGIATIGFSLGTSHFEHFTSTRLAGLGSMNFGNVITEIQNFLSPTFSLSLSYFCWISTTPMPKFTLFPQFPKWLETVPITQINSRFSNIQRKDSGFHQYFIS